MSSHTKHGSLLLVVVFLLPLATAMSHSKLVQGSSCYATYSNCLSNENKREDIQVTDRDAILVAADVAEEVSSEVDEDGNMEEVDMDEATDISAGLEEYEEEEANTENGGDCAMPRLERKLASLEARLIARIDGIAGQVETDTPEDTDVCDKVTLRAKCPGLIKDIVKNIREVKRKRKVKSHTTAVRNEAAKKVYFVSAAPLTWQRAEATCKRHGAELMTIDSQEENTFIQAQVKTLSKGKYGSYLYWLGGNDFDKSRSWVWGKDTPFTFFDWGSREPNSVKEHCLNLLRHIEYKWNDGGCEVPGGFICQTEFDKISKLTGGWAEMAERDEVQHDEDGDEDDDDVDVADDIDID